MVFSGFPPCSSMRTLRAAAAIIASGLPTGGRDFRLRPAGDRVAESPATGAVDGGKEEAGKEGEVVDKEAELGLIARPVRRAMEGEGQENHISPGEERGFGE